MTAKRFDCVRVDLRNHPLQWTDASKNDMASGDTPQKPAEAARRRTRRTDDLERRIINLGSPPERSSRMQSNITTSVARQQKILHLLTHDAGGGGADARAVAEAVLRRWIQAACELALLIGQGGVRAIYARTLHLTRSSYPWLPEAADPTEPDSPFTELRVTLERQAAPQALEAGTAFLVTFTDVLATLIGEVLTTGLMNSAWPDRAPGLPAKEPEQ